MHYVSMNLMSKGELQTILAVVQGLKKDQWKQVIQSLSTEGSEALRKALAHSFQGIADQIRGSARAKGAAGGV